MDSLLQDLRYAIRMCVRTPGFTTVAVLALAIGIGANTAIFTIVNAALIERLPFKDPARLVVLWEESSRRPGKSNVVGPANYLRWRERADAFEDLAGFVDTPTNLTGSGTPEELTIQNVTSGFFPILGVSPLMGRTFTDAEHNDPNAPVTILSHALWQRRFGGDRAIVGRTIQLNGKPATVIGVMPPDVQLFMKGLSLTGKPADLWQTWMLRPEARNPRGRFMSVVGRLKPGVSVAQAQSQMNTIAAGLAPEFPQFDTGWGVRVLSLRDQLAGDLRPALLTLAGAVAFVLLIACANVANLLLARGAARQREIAIRTALGAARTRLIRQLLTESLVLGLLGGALGLLIAQWGLDVMVALSPIDLTQVGHIRLSYPVLAFSSLLLAIFAAVALLLASIGIYGVMSYAVSQRTSEIGIRLALGAERRDIMKLVVGNGVRLAAAGLAIGVVLALALSRTLTALLYETTGTDPVTFAAVIAVLAVVALVASYLPARRASRIAPVEALRYQ